MLRSLLVLAALAALCVPARAAASRHLAAPAQTAGATCLRAPAFEVLVPECPAAAPLTGLHAVTVSPDGQDVYVPVTGDEEQRGGGVNVLGSALTPLGCVTDDAGAGWPGTEGSCDDGDALRGTTSVAVSPDGRSVYAAAPYAHAIAWFDRAGDGRLTQRGCLDDLPRAGRCVHTGRLGAPNRIAVSPDGRNVYATDWARGALLTFDRDDVTGALTFSGCLSASGADGACRQAGGLTGAYRLAVTSDAVFVLAFGQLWEAAGTTLTSFARSARTGALEPVDCAAAGAAPGGRCLTPRAFDGARSLAVAGGTVYVGRYAAENSPTTVIHAFARDGARLRYAGCLTPASEPLAGCAASAHLLEARWLAASADGSVVVAAGGARLVGFTRDPATGALSDAWCATEAFELARDPLFAGCAVVPGTYRADTVTVAPDGRSVYTTRTRGAVLATLRAGPAAAYFARRTGSPRAASRRAAAPRAASRDVPLHPRTR
ncbi:MAG TPA: hypothetical protein VNS09_15455 [Solirubrobacter sp.]|nr:hypothetical protein [Solirubrobacter sp.]